VGADFQLILGGGTQAHLDARYVIELDDGSRVFVQNTALRVASLENSQRIMNGQPVNPGRGLLPLPTQTRSHRAAMGLAERKPVHRQLAACARWGVLELLPGVLRPWAGLDHPNRAGE
jgi:hypothetical protein